MKVAFFGDCHGHIKLMYDHARAWEAERTQELGLTGKRGKWYDATGKLIGEYSGEEITTVVQVGDFGFYPYHEGLDRASRDHFKPREPLFGEYEVDERGDYPHYREQRVEAPYRTYVIRGNHEDQDYLLEHEHLGYDKGADIWRFAPRMAYAPDGAYFTLGSYTFAALGGNYSHKTWTQGKPRKELKGRQLNHIDPTVWRKLMDGPEFDILLTHDAPSGIGMLNRRDPGKDGCAQIRQLIEAKVRRFSFSGHWHHRLEAKIGRSQHFALDKTDPTVPRERSMVVLDLPD